MKKLIACLIALTFVASCTKSAKNSETSANKYSAPKAEESVTPKKEAKAEKKEKKAKVKKHGGSEVK